MIDTSDVSDRYEGDDSTATYDFDFRIFAKSDLAVKVRGPNDDADTVLTIGTDYTIPDGDVNNDDGGTITLVDNNQAWMSSNSYLEDGYIITLVSELPYTQASDFANQDDFYGENHETAFDKASRRAAQLYRLVSRVLKAPDTDPDSILTLPSSSSRASKYLAFDADGDPIASSGTVTDSVSVSSFAETLLDDANAQTARETLGFNGTGGTIQAGDLEDDAVTEDKIIDDAVTEDKILNGAVAKAKLANTALDLSLTSDPSSPYTVLSTDRIITLNNSSAKTATLPALASSAGRTIKIQNIGSNLTNAITVQGNGGSEIIGIGSATSIKLKTQGETVTLFGGSGRWYILDWYVPSVWTTFTPTGSWSANTTYTGRYRRVADSLDLQVKLALSGAPTSTGLTVNIPSGLGISPSKMVANDVGNSIFNGNVSLLDNGTLDGSGLALYQSTTAIGIYQNDDGAGMITHTQVSETSPFTWASGDALWINISGIPITDWGPQL